MASPDHPPARKPARIVVVDDNGGDFQLLREASREIRFDARYEHIARGDALLPSLERAHLAGASALPDLILLDINLPRGSGHDVLSALKSDRRFSGIPVVMYSSSVRSEDHQETRDNGAIGFMAKPSTFEGYFPLLGAIRDLLESRADGAGEG